MHFIPLPVVIVCGGRDFSDAALVNETLDDIDPIRVLHGGAPGADSLAAAWCARTKTECIAFPAHWKKYGRAAGPLRNNQMLASDPDIAIVIAFQGGKETADMVLRAERAGIMVHRVSAKATP